MGRLFALLPLFLLLATAAFAQVPSMDPVVGRLGFCLGPQLNWTAVAGATEYRVAIDGVPFAGVDSTTFTTQGVWNLDAPGETHSYCVQAKLGGIWQLCGPAINYTFDCQNPILPNRWEGPRTTVVGLFKFPDVADEPITVADTNTMIFTDLNNWLLDASRGHTSLSDFDPEFSESGRAVAYGVMPHPITHYCPNPFDIGGGVVVWGSCAIDRLRNDAVNVLAAVAGVYAWDFDVKLFAFSHALAPTSGAANFSTFGVFPGPTNQFRIGVIGHEMGHDTGIYHANSWYCSDRDVAENLDNAFGGNPTCSLTAYGGQTVMGGGILEDKFSAFEAEVAGWLSSFEGPNFTSCGVATAHLKPLYGTISPRELRVALEKNNVGTRAFWFYSLDYHPEDGVRIWLKPHGRNYIASFINPHNYSDGDHLQVNNWGSAVSSSAITPTNQFYDPYRHITIEVTAMSTDDATVRITRTCPGGGGGSPGCPPACQQGPQQSPSWGTNPNE